MGVVDEPLVNRTGSSQLFGRTAGGERQKLHVMIADDIRRQVELAQWPLGEVLGSEAALAQSYGVSRSIMREAVRLLEHQQVATMTRGPSGGLTVRAPTGDAVIHAIGVVFDFRGVSLGELLQVKALLERWCVRATAARISPDGLELLEAAARAKPLPLGESVLATRQDRFHGEIADQSGNPVATALLAAVTALAVRYSPTALQHDSTPGQTLTDIEHAHTAIVDAIRANDVELATRRMDRHLSHMFDWLRASHGERALWTDVQVQRAAERRGSSSAKLAEIVAERIRDDVIAGGWVVGASLGTEPTLLERYSVSRSVFREAVRLLEYHSVVAYRPGNNGGLVVDKPSVDAVVRGASSYLRYHSVNGAQLAEMRVLCEREAASLAASRSATATSALARALTRGDTGTPGLCTSQFHLALAELSDNRALALLIEILLRLQVDMNLVTDGQSPTGDRPDSLRDHSAILEAVVSGQPDVAAATIERHLATGVGA
jgi:DNA-binding FadR family transcriptional regulator